jgi:hypothetical protein
MSRKLSFLRENLLINDAVLETSHEFKVSAGDGWTAEARGGVTKTDG